MMNGTSHNNNNNTSNNTSSSSSSALRFNPATGYYEGSITIRVEPEIFQRLFFGYVTEHGIDITNPEALALAVAKVSDIIKWIDHPRSIKVVPVVPVVPVAPVVPVPPKTTSPLAPPPPLPSPSSFVEESPLPRPLPPAPEDKKDKKDNNKEGDEEEEDEDEEEYQPFVYSWNEQDQRSFRTRLETTPMEEWDNLITPLLQDIPHSEKQARYHRRSAEKKLIEQLRKERAAVSPEKIAVIAQAVNGARIR